MWVARYAYSIRVGRDCALKDRAAGFVRARLQPSTVLFDDRPGRSTALAPNRLGLVV